MWDLIVSVPDHCLSFYFPSKDISLVEMIHSGGVGRECFRRLW